MMRSMFDYAPPANNDELTNLKNQVIVTIDGVFDQQSWLNHFASGKMIMLKGKGMDPTSRLDAILNNSDPTVAFYLADRTLTDLVTTEIIEERRRLQQQMDDHLDRLAGRDADPNAGVVAMPSLLLEDQGIRYYTLNILRGGQPPGLLGAIETIKVDLIGCLANSVSKIGFPDKERRDLLGQPADLEQRYPNQNRYVLEYVNKLQHLIADLHTLMINPAPNSTAEEQARIAKESIARKQVEINELQTEMLKKIKVLETKCDLPWILKSQCQRAEQNIPILAQKARDTAEAFLAGIKANLPPNDHHWNSKKWEFDQNAGVLRAAFREEVKAGLDDMDRIIEQQMRDAARNQDQAINQKLGALNLLQANALPDEQKMEAVQAIARALVTEVKNKCHQSLETRNDNLLAQAKVHIDAFKDKQFTQMRADIYNKHKPNVNPNNVVIAGQNEAPPPTRQELLQNLQDPNNHDKSFGIITVENTQQNPNVIKFKCNQPSGISGKLSKLFSMGKGDTFNQAMETYLISGVLFEEAKLDRPVHVTGDKKFQMAFYAISNCHRQKDGHKPLVVELRDVESRKLYTEYFEKAATKLGKKLQQELKKDSSSNQNSTKAPPEAEGDFSRPPSPPPSP